MIWGAFTNELTRTISSRQEQHLTLMNAPRADFGYEIKYDAETRSVSWSACPSPSPLTRHHRHVTGGGEAAGVIEGRVRQIGGRRAGPCREEGQRQPE